MLIPLYALWAILGHVANGAAFVIDKTLLRSSFKRSATYAGMVGILGAVAIVLVPFGAHLPSTTGVICMTVSGAAFVLALDRFFRALSEGEASRVVPVIGSLIPILTLMGTSLFLGERLTSVELAGFGLLIFATLILSGGAAKSRLRTETIGIAVLAAGLFALSSVTGKAAYTSDGFMTSFIISRYAGVLMSIVLLLADADALKETIGILRPGAKPAASGGPAGRSAIILVLVGQALGSLGFVLVQYASSLGSAAIVNALQAVQYAFLVLAAFLLRHKAPQLLGEDLTPNTIMRKTAAIVFVAAGLWCTIV